MVEVVVEPRAEARSSRLRRLDRESRVAFLAKGRLVDMDVPPGFDPTLILCLNLAGITGIGGGMLRDVLLGETPTVLRRELYAGE